MNLRRSVLQLSLLSAMSFPLLAADFDATYLADRARIEDVLVRYAIAHNTTEPALYRDVFARDAKIMTASGAVVLDGLDAILASVETDKERFNPGYQQGERTYSNMRHLISNVEISIDGDTAHTSCYLLNIAFNTTSGKPEILGMGRYVDELARHGDQWLIEERVMYIDWGNDELSAIIGVGPHTPTKYRN